MRNHNAYTLHYWGKYEAMRTTIVTVTYNSEDVIPQFIDNIPRDCTVVFVDNASTDSSVGLIKASGYTPIINSNNEGFGRACNLGAASADTEFIFFVNPDAVLEPDCIKKLEEEADKHPEMLAANPYIYRNTGRLSMKSRSALLRKRDLTKITTGISQSANMMSGCALFCRKSAFEEINGFDPNIFLYHEDDDISVRFDKTEGAIRWVHDAIVHHSAGYSSPRTPEITHFKHYHMARSSYYVLKKHGKPTRRLFILTRIFLNLLLPHNFLSARRRRKFVGHFYGLFSTFRDNGAHIAS